MRKFNLEGGAVQYALTSTDVAGKSQVLWKSDATGNGPYGRGNYGPKSLSLSSIVSKFEDGDAISIMVYANPIGAFVFHYTSDATQIEPIRIHYLRTPLDPPGRFELRGHGVIAFLADGTDEERMVRFDETGKITEDFRPRKEPIGGSVPERNLRAAAVDQVDGELPNLMADEDWVESRANNGEVHGRWVPGVIIGVMLAFVGWFARKSQSRLE